MSATVLTFPSSSPVPSPDPSPDNRPPALGKIRDLRMAIWLTPFITDGDTRTQLLELTDAIAADLDCFRPVAAGGAR